jgi:hypothetical protein
VKQKDALVILVMGINTQLVQNMNAKDNIFTIAISVMQQERLIAMIVEEQGK